MGKIKILLVSSSFYPEISPRSFRATELAKEFCEQGNEVTVISKFRKIDYSYFLQSYPMALKMWGKPLFPPVPKLKGMPFSSVARALSRILMLLFEYPGIEEMIKVKKMLANETGYDLMISFAVPFPVHWGVAWARSEKNQIARIWVADCGDPYMFGRLDTFKKPFYFRFPEVRFCQMCDYITVPFIEMQDQFYPQFKPKITVIPQGFKLNDIVLCKQKPECDRPVFIFAGSIIPGKRDLALFLDFLSAVETDFLFIIYTNQIEWFDKYKASLGKRLKIYGFIDRLALIFEMSKADFLVNVDSALDNYSNVEAIPSKLVDYALARRPILNLNSASLDKETIIEFLNQNYSKQRIINLSNHDIKHVSVKFLELIN